MPNPAPVKRTAAKEFRMTIAVAPKSIDVAMVSITDLKHQIAQMEIGEVLMITRTK